MDSIRNVVIFGATGNTGLCALEAAVLAGYNVTAFVRDAGKIPQDLCSSIRTIVGDVMNFVDVENAVEGQDAVVIVLGTRNDLSPTTVMSEGTATILNAMKKYNVSRVSACISAFLFWERSKVPEKYHPLTEDHEKMLDYLKESDLEWTAVLPPHITGEKGRGSPLVAHDRGPGRTISKFDLGKFLVNCLPQSEHFRQVCGICDNPE